jgi:hypothetical protein
MPKVSICGCHSPSAPVRANYKPQAALIPGPSNKGQSLNWNGIGAQSSTWDSLEEQPPVIIHDMDFEPAMGVNGSTKVRICAVF